MKTITLSFILFAFSLQAQTFPSPYCDIDESDTTIEEITSVAFADASITNSDDSSILIDKTSSVTNLVPGETYTITVKGNTDGNFANNIVAFIDWNQNETLDDEGEVYEIGTLTDSDGNDNTSVSMDITVPMDAVEGPTRIRITKTYTDVTSPAIINPCAIEMDAFGMGAFPGFGQALDFTLDIEEASSGGFPSPYCDIDESGTTIEEITSIEFADANITNSDDSSVLIDETSTVTNLTRGETYTITVEGNTYGDFDTNIVAFIDWNQNETLDDEGEVYEIGTLTDSDGNDNTSVSMDITVPMDAVEGPTRIRITKTFSDIDSPAIINPCAIEMDAFGMGAFPGFGQALDFTLEIGTLGIDSFDTSSLKAYPVPTSDVLNLEYKSVINSVKIFNLLGKEVYSQNTSDSKLQVNVSSLSAGAYVVKLVAEEAQHTFQIIKK